jgi:tetratricopeptide (TPR) repeat protein
MLPGSMGAPPEGAEAVSFLGAPLRAPALSAELLEQRTRELADAEAALAAAPGDADALIWVGRRQAYLGRYRDAIETFSEGIRLHPDDARMYRHRAHRWITVREVDRAIEDFNRGVELIAGTSDQVEPDGLPNPLGIPTSTLHFNIWYHLGLAHYLKGSLDQALAAYEECMAVSTNPDALAATSYWLHLTLRRLGRDSAAAAILDPFGADYEVIENQAYLDLLRLFRGDTTPEAILGPSGEAPTLQGTTGAYGVGAWHLVNGRTDAAMDIFRRVVAAEDQWAAFGYIAAEAELVRAGEGR